MKKIRFVLSALALILAFTAAVGFVNDTEVFRLDPNTGQLKVPHEIVTGSSYICDPESPQLFCTQEWEVNSSNQPIQPVADPEMGEYTPQ